MPILLLPGSYTNSRSRSATTAARALFDNVFLKLDFPSTLLSDRGGEFLNDVLREVSRLLSIKQVFTSSYRPRANGATERVHRFMNSALAIFASKRQCSQLCTRTTHRLSTALIVLHHSSSCLAVMQHHPRQLVFSSQERICRTFSSKDFRGRQTISQHQKSLKRRQRDAVIVFLYKKKKGGNRTAPITGESHCCPSQERYWQEFC